MDAHFDCIRGESHWETMIESTFEFMKKKKILVEGERGALVVHFPEETKLPTMLYKRSDGATLYQTRDLTRILYYDREGYDILLHVVGSDQFMHFKRVFETAKMLGIAVACEHIDFGLVRLPEGKMSTRKGITIDLMNIFEEAERRVRASLDERNIDFSQEEKEKLVKILSVGAVKFNDLSQNRTTDITFNWEKMLSFEGFSAPFLQYSYARANSIFKKDRDTNFVPDDFVIQQNAEKRLTKKILQFPQIVIAACEKRAPHLMAQYLYELASVFNSFYVQCPILKAPEKQKKSRLFLTKKMSETLKKGLCLLTIEAPERM
jgi:arginyl-tRNA synthetase